MDKFPGHIACSSLSKSEIVVPIFRRDSIDDVFGVLDVDSEFLEHFDETDKRFLEEVCAKISQKI